MVRSSFFFLPQVLQKEVTSYEGSEKFKNKVAECDGRVEMKWTSGRVGEIYNILTKMVKERSANLRKQSVAAAPNISGGGCTRRQRRFRRTRLRSLDACDRSIR